MQLQRRGALPAPLGRPRSCSRLLQRCIRRYATSDCCHHGDSTNMFGCEHGLIGSWRLASSHGIQLHAPEDKEITG